MTHLPVLFRAAALILLGSGALLALLTAPAPARPGVLTLLLLTALLVRAARAARRRRDFHAWVRAQRTALTEVQGRPERWALLAADDAGRLLSDLTLSTERGEWSPEEARETYAAYCRKVLPADLLPAAPGRTP